MTSKTSDWLAGTGCLLGFSGIGLLIYFIINGNTKMGIILIVLFWVFALILLNKAHNRDELMKEKQKRYISTFRPNEIFKETQAFTSPDLLTRIAYDEELKRICIWAPQSQSGDPITKVFQNLPYEVYEYHFGDILAAEISEDGYPIAAAFRDSPSAIQLLEGIFKEEYDAINESIHNRQEPMKISSMELKLIVNDLTKPIHRIPFYVGGSLNKDTPKYRGLLSEMRQWHIIIKFALNEADKMELGGTETLSRKNEMETQEALETGGITDEQESTQPNYLETEMEETVQPNVEKMPAVFQPTEGDTLSDFEKLLETNKRKQFGDK